MPVEKIIGLMGDDAMTYYLQYVRWSGFLQVTMTVIILLVSVVLTWRIIKNMKEPDDGEIFCKAVVFAAIAVVVCFFAIVESRCIISLILQIINPVGSIMSEVIIKNNMSIYCD